MNPFEGRGGIQLQRALMVAAWVFVAFLAVEVVSVVKGIGYVGSGIQATDTIAVSGHGEFLAVPDIATFSFSVVSDKATVADAQSDATAKANAVTAYLTGAGVAAADIQTSDYSIEPQYEYQNAVCPTVAPAPGVVNSGTVYCPPGKQTLTGYEVSQTTTVKVRDTSKAGDLLAGVGSKGATQVSGLSFTFDDPSAPQEAARDKAIADAQQKAQALAKQLGVSLVRVVSFSENGNNSQPVMPMAFAASAGSTAAPAPDISVGQNDVTDDVTITYEIQ